MKLFLITLLLVSFALLGQKTKPEVMKIKKDDLSKIKTIKDLLPTTYKCIVSTFDFSFNEKGGSHFFHQQLGDTGFHRKQREIQMNGLTSTTATGHEWLIFLKHLNPGDKLYIDSLTPSCSSPAQKIYTFLIVE